MRAKSSGRVMGNREQGTGNREQGTGNREQGTGNREQGTGNREQGTGGREQASPPSPFRARLQVQSPRGLHYKSEMHPNARGLAGEAIEMFHPLTLLYLIL
ncbi:MAG: hypothetical protein EBE86_002235 [Hormoscilla sp. GUM202]|nr:hypothetical protein [Hormoscilla sp. GUM202]